MTFVYFILLLGILIFIHEFGHFITAKILGVDVLTFSLGFGPRLLGFKYKDTDYRLSLLPLGGYVKFRGDDPTVEIPVDERKGTFNYAPIWKRTLIVIAGPVANLLLPIFVFFVVFLGESTLNPSVVGSVQDGGPAQQAGLQAGDTIKSIDGEEVAYFYQVLELISDNPGKTMPLIYDRGGELFQTEITPEGYTPEIAKKIGFGSDKGRILITNYFYAPAVSVTPGSPAAEGGLQDGDVIIDIDGSPVKTYHDIETLLGAMGSTTHSLVMKVQRVDTASAPDSGASVESGDSVDSAPAEGASSTDASSSEPPTKVVELILPTVQVSTVLAGLAPVEFRITEVTPDTPADTQIGLQTGDRILTLDGKAFATWHLLVQYLSKHVDDEHTITFQRGTEQLTKTFSLIEKTEKGEYNEERKVITFGAKTAELNVLPDPIPNDGLVGYAFSTAVKETWHIIEITGLTVAGLVTGQVPLKEMGGPILIAQLSGKTAEHGWSHFFNVLVWISINLGILNLLPVPVLDGGHLLLFSIEGIRRKPLGLKARTIITYIGLMFLVLLMVLVFTNDIVRNWDSITGWFG